jgi:hypothetical protein
MEGILEALGFQTLEEALANHSCDLVGLRRCAHPDLMLVCTRSNPSRVSVKPWVQHTNPPRGTHTINYGSVFA